MFLRSLILVGFLSLTAACAAQKKGASAADRQAQALVVLLENRTDHALFYRHTNFYSQQDTNSRGETNISMGLGQQLNDSSLAPGQSARLNVMPNSDLNLRFTQNSGQKELSLKIQEHQTLRVLAADINKTMGMPGFQPNP